MPAGRPLNIPTPEEFQKRADGYFWACDNNVTGWELDGVTPIVEKIPYTVTGLCLALGICRDSFRIEYRVRPEFLGVTASAMNRIAQDLETNALTGKRNANFSKFLLGCCHGYTETVNQNVTHIGERKTTITFVE